MKNFNPTQVCLPEMTLMFCENQNELRTPLIQTLKNPQIGIARGKVLIDSMPVDSIFQDDTFYWETEEGDNKEKWALLLKPFGQPHIGVMEKNGIIRKFMAMPQSRYKMHYMHNGTQVNFDFIYGVEKTDEGHNAYCKILFNNQVISSSSLADKAESMIYNDKGFGMYVNDKSIICVDADLSVINIIRDFEQDYLSDFYALYFQFEISGSFETIKGKAKLEKSEEGVELTGEIDYGAKNTNSLKAGNTIRVAQLKKNCVNSNFTANLKTSNDLSITELFSLPVPDQQTVSEQFSYLFFNTMMYYAADLKYKYIPKNMEISYADWLGVKRPLVIKSFATLLGYGDDNKKTLNFIMNLTATTDTEMKKLINAFIRDFSTVSISNAFSCSEDSKLKDAFDIDVSSTATSKEETIHQICNYYFSGKYEAETEQDYEHPASMALNPIAVKLQKKLMCALYEVKVEGFSKYCHNDKESWAKALYQKCLQNISGIISKSYLVGGSLGYVKHLCTMLDCLDDSPQIILEERNPEATQDTPKNEQKAPSMISYAEALYTHVLNLEITQLIDNLTITTEDEVICRNFLKEFFEQLLDTYYSQSKLLSVEVNKSLAEITTKLNKKTEEQQREALDAQIDEMIIFMTKSLDKNPISSGLSKYPFAKSLFGELGPLAMYGLAIYLVHGAFKNPGKSSWDEMGVAVTLCLRVVAGVTCDVLRLSAIRTLSNPTAPLGAKIDAAYRMKFGGDDFHMVRDIYANADGISLPEEIEQSARYKVSEEYKVHISKTTKFFRGMNIFMRVANIALLAFSAYSLGKKISNDIENNESNAIIAMGFMQEICIGGMLLLEGTSLILDAVGICCEVIPYIGTILMIGTVIFTFIEMILEGKKPVPENPEVMFTKDVLTPFLKKLPLPSVEWVVENCNKQVLRASANKLALMQRQREYILAITNTQG